MNKEENSDYPVCEYCKQKMSLLKSGDKWYWSCQNDNCYYNQYLVNYEREKDDKEKNI